MIGVVTDKDGKFQVDLAPGIYLDERGLVRVDEGTLKLELKLFAPPPLIGPGIHRWYFDIPLQPDPSPKA